MKFAHLADCHIGGWKEEKLKQLGLRSFEFALDLAIKERVGFILISGDLFDTALPSIDIVKDVARILNKVKSYDIPVYIIPGSHDFSPSGKTMLDVYEEAGLVENVCKISEGKLGLTTDRTGIKISGMLGKKGGLEVEDYKTLDKKNLEAENGFKIFMFHSLLNEAKPKNFDMIEGLDLQYLPRNFNYYAGGHPHFIYGEKHQGYGLITYPGPSFPNNFAELEELKYGGFYINEITGGILSPRHFKLKIVDCLSYNFDASGKIPRQVQEEILNDVKDFNGKIVLLRVSGELASGKPSEIDFKLINEQFKDAFIVLRNTAKLFSKEFEIADIKIEDVSKVEEKLIEEVSKTEGMIFSQENILKLMNALDKEKLEGEKTADFENRIVKEAKEILGLEWGDN